MALFLGLRSLVFWSKTDARAISKPKPPSLWLLLRNLKAFFPPNGVDSIFANSPTFIVHERSDRSITISSVLRSKLYHSTTSEFFFKIVLWLVSLSPPWLPNHTTSTALTHTVPGFSRLYSVSSSDRA